MLNTVGEFLVHAREKLANRLRLYTLRLRHRQIENESMIQLGLFKLGSGPNNGIPIPAWL